MVDVEELSRQLVRHLRGERSQRALSRQLQYTTNVVYLWESGRRWPSASAFFWLAHRTGCDVSGALTGFVLGDALPDIDTPWKPAAVTGLLKRLQGRTPATELAARLDRSRDAVGRWLRGETEPKLPALLQFVDASSTRLLDFVALFADPAALPAAAEAWRRLEAARRLTREQPWAPAVLLALELEPPLDDRALADRLGLPPALVAECLPLLEAAGQIQRVQGRWKRVEVQAVDTRIPTRPADLKTWWAQVAAERLRSAEGTASFTVCAVSQDDFARIQQLQRQYYRQVRTLIAASAPCERVVLINLQAIALDRGDGSQGVG